LIESRILGAVTVAFLVSAVFLVALRPVAIALNLVDKPGGRKLHEGDVPIIGGVAMFAGMFAGLLMLKFPTYFLLPIFVASTLILVIGVVDDRFHLPTSARMSAQVAATLIMVYGANSFLESIGAPFGTGEVYMGRFWLIFTMLVTLSMINAYNLIDGVDGLAGSLALIALLSIAAAAGIHHAGAVAAVVVSAAIVGFLIFNFPTIWNRKERTFMGDAGSTLLGFTIVWVALGVSQGEERVISPVYCLWFASIPIYDLFTCFVRRMLKAKSPFSPGRDHFHHKLMRGGFGVRQTLGILTGLQALYATAGLAAYFAGFPDVAMFTAWSVLGLSQHFVIMTIAKYHRVRSLQLSD
jgi:UDP-GlcNAc:undecaprenyl-phosphate GlcNAc-1-phosphate transferase